MAIKPIDLPSAAGVNRGEGDVRHFSEGDSFSVPGVSGPTRELAERDNLLAEKLNETIQTVNNKEQFVPLPIVRTTLPPNDNLVVTNYRIPAGFEARVLNAAIASSPLSSDIQLIIYYAEGFGNTSGEALVTTSDEATSGTSFKQNGEFVIVIRNTGGITLDIVASILLTMRPIGDVGTLLVGSVIQGEQGRPGQTGPQGLQGIPGTGGQGSPGMIWTGAWTNGRGYNANEVASFALYGTVISSYIVRTAHSANPSNQPPTAPYWDTVALGSAGSVQGVQGPPGAAGAGAAFESNITNGTFVTGLDWAAGSWSGNYTAGAVVTPNTQYTFAFREVVVMDTTYGTGVAFLQASVRTAFRGHGTLYLPTIAGNAAQCDYSNDFINAVAASNGTSAVEVLPSSGTYARLVECYPVGNRAFVVNVNAPQPMPVSILMNGMQPVL
jgi:hypothetical protein